jgi:hypothetical protein
MEPLTIKTPADVLSFVGHTLGFWPQESLVCITLDTNRVGATLRVDLPTHEGGLQYARTVADYLAHDATTAIAWLEAIGFNVVAASVRLTVDPRLAFS